MKYISKQQQPYELIAWVHAKSENEEAKHQHWTYDDMYSDVRQAVKASLIREQGGLCCYTGRAIRQDSSHIEHLKPQSLCINHEDTDYDNLLAAYPSSESGTPHCSYGAHERKNWYDEQLFVHPRRRDCEQRFRYRDSGRVVAMSETDTGATETIQRLQLDHLELQRMRKSAIDALELEELSPAQARRLLDAMDQRDSKGHFQPFCFVIKQACVRYLKRFETPKGKK